MAVTGGPTLRYVVYDILGDLKQIYKDAIISPFKTAYWVLVHADRLKKLHIEKRDSGAFVVPFDMDVVVDPGNGRNYFELPENIYDMDKDRAIEYITYPPSFDSDYPMFAGVTFTRVNVSEVRRLYFREDEKPSPANPYFYRLQDRIYLLGVEQINLTSVESGLFTTFSPAASDLSLDAEFDFPQDLIPQLKIQILNMGRFVLTIPRDVLDDGTSLPIQSMPKDKLVSANDNVNNRNNE